MDDNKAAPVFSHYSVLLYEAVDRLAIKPDGVYMDCTLGGGGHSLEILKRLGDRGRLIAVDQDAEAIAASKKRLADYLDKIDFIHDNFENAVMRAKEIGYDGIDGAVIDLGVSSYQLDTPERGFSYMKDAPLDMRMDRQQALSAWDVVNTWSREDIRHILFEYGEERYAPLIAAAIERERGKKPIETTLELVDIIRGAMPAKALREKQHPAKRSFQAIRIAVNDELGAVREAMEKAIDCLNPGGRLAVITFHSLEDRIVKAAFNQAAQGCTCPKDFPVCVCGKKPKVRLTPRKPILPSDEEIEENPRARSAKLRVCEKI